MIPFVLKYLLPVHLMPLLKLRDSPNKNIAKSMTLSGLDGSVNFQHLKLLTYMKPQTRTDVLRL